MLIDYEYKKKKLILSYIGKDGNIKLHYKDWESPMRFIQTSSDDKDKHNKYVTWDGRSVKEIYTKYPNKYSIYDYIDTFPEEEQKMLYDYNEPNIFFVDIENEITDSKPQPHLAQNKILSLSVVNKNKVMVLGFQPLTDAEQRSIQNDINNEYGKKFNKEYVFKYICYNNEYEMMLNFFKLFVPKMAVITGWYFITYDWVYLVNRARKLGIDPALASFTGNLKESNPNDPKDYAEMPLHRIIIDYMEIYKKWDTSVKIKESNELDFVADKILGVKKVNYEGNLKHLYEKEYKKFIYYNAVDSILVQLIHEKMKYADILYSIATLSRITVTTALSTLAVTEGILRKKLRDQKNIVLIKNDSLAAGGSVKGGWVKVPIRGMAEYTCCFDFSSLYPTVMRSCNISADCFKGVRIKNTMKANFNGHEIDILPNDIITINNAVFECEDGVVTQVMTNIFAQRKNFKNQMVDKGIELSLLKKDLEELEKCFL